MAHNTSYLPPEIIENIIENILSRLRAKSLLRFKSVSKSWNTMIVVQNHIRQSKHSNSDNLFLCPNTYPIPVVKLGDKKIQTLQRIESRYARWHELCFCDGVILLTDATYMRFALWNPSTRTSKNLWHKYSCPEAAFGLCRDPATDDFKVVIADSNYYSVYSCKNKSWIMLKKKYDVKYTGLGVNLSYNNIGVCVDGASYWVWGNDNATQIELVYFDPRDDEFKILHMPENIADANQKFTYAVELKGCLCLYYNGMDESRIQIWTKEKGIDGHSWKELITVENVGMSIWAFQPLCFVGDKIVVWKRGLLRRVLLIYIPSEKRFEEFEKDTVGIFDYPIPYIDSIFFPTEKPKPKMKRKRKFLQ
ncbi:hypothetical protein MIMGU_mgv1a025685mg [Erythranthe guttata]|uniref:F-box domain-containing protein n=1 Tax=Erythranthe guttata TaxID=4155 RepID=A0A022R3J7_ERYGU|nr:hypothetical protein MIMGU_mgv1a025685mg [Erythranthe guttata]